MKSSGSEFDGAAACALPEEELPARLSLWRAIADHALSRKTEPGRIVSSHPRSDSNELRALIKAEAKCCPFLTFEIRERGGILEVEVRYPLEFEPMIEAVTGRVSTT